MAGASPLLKDKVIPTQSGKRPIDITSSPEMMRALSETTTTSPASSSPSPSPRDNLSLPQASFVVQGWTSPEEAKDSPQLIETLEVVDHSLAKATQPIEAPASRAFSFGREFKKTPLYDWLASYKLESLFEVLVHNGYEDYDSIIGLMQSSNPLDTLQLQSIGVKKPGHRDRLIALLEEELREADVQTKKSATSPFTCCTRAVSRNGHELSMALERWLETLGLGFLFEKLQEAGYDDLEQIIFLQKTRFALDDQRLTEIGIDKVGHRHRILNKLQAETYFGTGANRRQDSELVIERDSRHISCESCLVM
jgi:hypothetical protein